MSQSQKTFSSILIEQNTSHALFELLEAITNASLQIADLLKVGAVEDVLGSAESDNVQGEVQKKLDIISNDIFVEHCSKLKGVAALVSEEVEDVYWLKKNPSPQDLIVYFDPLDGSSNVDVNLSVGSIFSITKVGNAYNEKDQNSILHKGTNQICAGYVVYGPSTSLVLTLGKGVNGYTYDPKSNGFVLTHENMRVPNETNEYAINTSRYQYWHAPIKRYIDECVEGEKGARDKKFNMRWTASMVADVHRILVRGGIFMYPMDTANAKTGGKLRLMYEANPMSFLIEQAGGAASTGFQRILEVEPNSPHQRVSVLLGSKTEIDLIDEYHNVAS
ncbi:MAG: class 1 fructose-bisphosphatase [Nitratireductor sp.]